MSGTEKSEMRPTPLSLYFWLTFISIAIATFLAALTLFIPLKQVPAIEALVNFTLSAMQLMKAGHESNYPDISRVYFSFSIPMALGFLGLLWRWGQSQDGKSSSGLLFVRRENLNLAHRAILVLLTPLWLSVVAGGWLGFSGGDSRLLSLGSNYAVLFALGWVFPAGIAAGVFLIAASLKKAITGKV